MVKDGFTDEIRQESPFADEGVEQVDESIERFSRRKTVYMCVNERETCGKVNMQRNVIIVSLNALNELDVDCDLSVASPQTSVLLHLRTAAAGGELIQMMVMVCLKFCF